MDITRHYVVEMITVSEHEISSAILIMLKHEKTLVEGAAGVAIAVVLNKKLPIATNRVGASFPVEEISMSPSSNVSRLVLITYKISNLITPFNH